MSTAWQRIGFSGWISAGTALAWLLNMAAAISAQAQAQTEPLIEGYAINFQDRKGTTDPLIEKPLPVSLEVEGLLQKRKLDFNDLGDQSVEVQRLGLFLGLDITRSLTLRGLISSGELKSDVGGAGDGNDDLSWGVDLEGRLINWQLDPTMVNLSWIQFDASLRYLSSLTEGEDNDLEWREVYGDLTVSLVSVPPDKDTVRSLTVFVGPAFSWIDGSMETAQGRQSDFSEDQLVGFTGGIVVVPHDNIKLKAGLLVFDEVSYLGAVEFHF
jgi:hypothetical protein